MPEQNPEVLNMIRDQVRQRLTASSAYQALPVEQRRAIAHDTVKALTYVVGGEDGMSVPGAVTLGGNAAHFAGAPVQELAQATRSVQPTRSAPARNGAQRQQQQQPKPKPTQAQFIEDAGQAFDNTVNNVNFPAFVGGLIDGVFNSIVTTSIKQMEAYAEMVKNVSKSVDQYMKDNVSENNARDYLLDKYPDHLDLDTSGDKARLKPKEGADDASMPDFFADLGLSSPVTSLDEDNVEQELVPAARKRIAMDRQQLLATMIMMGVNRLVVTNGKIEASCMFELDATQSDTRQNKSATAFDAHQQQASEWGASHGDTWDGTNSGDGSSSGGGGWFGGDKHESSYKYGNEYTNKNDWFAKGSQGSSANFKMTTASSTASERSIDLHAKLSGKVSVNFKSDYFPMEKMIDVFQISKIEEKTMARTARPAATLQQPAGPAPALPPMPALPMPQPAAPAPASSPK
jgi:hypothetical protein